MAKQATRALAATFTLGASELLQQRPFGSDVKPGQASAVEAPKEPEKTVVETDEERKRKSRSLTQLTTREGREAKAPTLKSLLQSGRTTLG